MLRVGETDFPRETPTNWLSNSKWSALKTSIHPSNTIQSKQVLITYIGIYVINTHVCHNKDNEFERRYLFLTKSQSFDFYL